MANVGLNNVGVEVDYRLVPPRCIVRCDLREVSAQLKECTELLSEIKEKQPAIVSGLQIERSDISKDPSGEIRCASPASSLEHRVERDEADEESVGASHIQLFTTGPRRI